MAIAGVSWQLPFFYAQRIVFLTAERLVSFTRLSSEPEARPLGWRCPAEQAEPLTAVGAGLCYLQAMICVKNAGENR